ncbi:MAG: dodecin domain-containing protein [Bacteroidetes bacterium]|nr:dodecin domain-containing protein [Bacteroidota bacterium]
MNHTEIHATSNNSWLEATKQLIAEAKQKSKSLRSISIQEDAEAKGGKFRLRTSLQTI